MSIIGKIKDLEGKKIAILGLGIENEAMLQWLLRQKIRAEYTVCDFRSEEQLGDRYLKLSKNKNISWRLGEQYNQRLYEFDILFRAPGWIVRCPGIAEAKRKNKDIEVTNSMNLFLQLCPSKNTIGVTGTKGKGTTSSLIAEIIRSAKYKVFLGGNIGIAPFAFLPKIKKDNLVVLELSSFQLEDMVHSPRIAVFTNFTKEHLKPADPNNPNYHRNLKEYFGAKSNIFLHAENKYLVANAKLESRIKNQEARTRVIYFTRSRLETILPGEHNLENIAAAEEVAKILKIPQQTVEKAVKRFSGLEYRIQKIGEWGGLSFYNDSFATIPEATITALKCFEVPVVVLLGGADKGSDFKALAREVKQRCCFAVLLKGDSTPRIEKALSDAGFPKDNMKEVSDIVSAVELAIEKARLPGVVLLSTACASFGMFKSYKQRGQLFTEAVRRHFNI
jgi:UDP-N-acetylmuramoylalanine--D-glutamate ligase